ncbi:MAG: EF-P lysine aminoacylase EpmA [Desulfobacterota bacterium]|nr:EF-P lysine aminoacylase EpmA [Thermodesulfobacteriota bacterium]
MVQRIHWALASRKGVLQRRARILQETRRFFQDRGYLEVETPYRLPTVAPESHIDPIPSEDWFLHPSPELCMKRMLAAGYEKIFQICRCWRRGERGRLHHPEFTLLEWYRVGAGYKDLMEECETFLRSLAAGLELGNLLTFRGRRIDLASPWERVTVKEAFRLYGEMTVEEALRQGRFDEVMVERIEPRLGIGKPTFLYDYPSERRSLSRLKPEDPSVAERFELYLGGLEIANAFTELNDPEEQRRVFQSEREARLLAGKEVYPMPEKFLEELEAMPPSAGIALGVDRLVMVLLDATTIDEVVAFTPEDL